MIGRAKSVAARSWSCSKLLKPQSHRAYDQVTTVKCENRGRVVEITYDGSQRSWPGDRQGKMSCNKVEGHVQNL